GEGPEEQQVTYSFTPHCHYVLQHCPTTASVSDRPQSRSRDGLSHWSFTFYYIIREARWFNECKSMECPKNTETQHVCVCVSDGLAVFRHFLRSEFSEENLDFWLAVEKFKRTCPQKMVFKATRIYNEFISCNATRQVNIDSAVRELTNQSLSLRISPSVFRLAQEQIYNLMLTDSYPRFLKSHLYTQLANQNLQQGQKLP
uniref:RGS domain-containing protein n=1 Tax=Periophthalmus magnuspinnatus TaxID=409849 RepID=A0A3B4AP65_9GOBI